jgi:hypothetical protein
LLIFIIANRMSRFDLNFSLVISYLNLINLSYKVRLIIYMHTLIEPTFLLCFERLDKVEGIWFWNSNSDQGEIIVWRCPWMRVWYIEPIKLYFNLINFAVVLGFISYVTILYINYTYFVDINLTQHLYMTALAITDKKG